MPRLTLDRIVPQAEPALPAMEAGTIAPADKTVLVTSVSIGAPAMEAGTIAPADAYREVGF